MAGNSHKFLKIIAHQINKSPLLNNASTAIGNATERAQEKISNIQSIASEKCGNIVKQVNGATIIQNLQAAALEPSPPLPKRLVNWWKWYQQLTGLDTVELSKQNVIRLQEKLFECQEQRRNLTHQTTAINDKLKEIYGELLHIKRDDPKYVQLTIMENKGLQEYRKISEQLNLLESEERDHFTHLATAIKEYHDTQAMNAQKYKYLSIVASALLAVLSILGSMIYNNKRIAEMNRSVAVAQQKNEAIFITRFDALENNLRTKFAETLAKIDNRSTAASENLNRGSLNELHLKNIDADFDDELPIPDIDLVKNVSFYVGLAIFTVYILQKLS